jgi:hypothetical protein
MKLSHIKNDQTRGARCIKAITVLRPDAETPVETIDTSIVAHNQALLHPCGTKITNLDHGCDRAPVDINNPDLTDLDRLAASLDALGLSFHEPSADKTCGRTADEPLGELS